MVDKQEYEPGRKWRVTREISYGHLITIFTVAVAALVFTVRLEGRINVNSEAISNNSRSVDQINNRMNTQYYEIIRRLEKISDRSDKFYNKADK